MTKGSKETGLSAVQRVDKKLSRPVLSKYAKKQLYKTNPELMAELLDNNLCKLNPLWKVGGKDGH